MHKRSECSFTEQHEPDDGLPVSVQSMDGANFPISTVTI
jgi:hypothetical protein